MSDAPLEVRAAQGGATLRVRAQPGAPRDQIVGVAAGALKVKVSAPPVEGAANERLLRYLAREILGCRSSDLRVSQGERGRDKVIEIAGLSPQEVLDRILPHLSGA